MLEPAGTCNKAPLMTESTISVPLFSATIMRALLKSLRDKILLPLLVNKPILHLRKIDYGFPCVCNNKNSLLLAIFPASIKPQHWIGQKNTEYPTKEK